MSTTPKTPTKQKPWRVRLPIVVDVDLEVYAGEYGMTVDEARADVLPHLTAVCEDAFGERLRLLGYGELVTK